jgi:Family of unknown function (DUF6272)
MELKKMNLFFTYSGAISQSDIADMCFTIQNRMQLLTSDKKDFARILTVFVELSQNMNNYLSTKQGSPLYANIISDSSIISLGQKNGEYFFLAGNLVENDDIPNIVSIQNELSATSNDELNRLYREKRRAPFDAEDTGAGMGFIEIYRKSKRVECTATPFSDNLSFLVFYVEF